MDGLELLDESADGPTNQTSLLSKSNYNKSISRLYAYTKVILDMDYQWKFRNISIITTNDMTNPLHETPYGLCSYNIIIYFFMGLQ
jgi:hypothetical protein